MFEFLTLDWVFNVIITVGIAVAFVYLIFRETGVEAKLKKIKKLQAEQITSGWGAEELKKLTKMQVNELLKISKKINKKIIIGVQEIGKAKLRIAITPTLFLYEIRSGILGNEKKFMIIDKAEISHVDKKNIFVTDDIINNKAGIFFLLGMSKDLLKQKTRYINFLIDKLNVEDTMGRISNLATKVSYLDIAHAQQSDLLMKRIDAMNKQGENNGHNISAMDFLSA